MHHPGQLTRGSQLQRIRLVTLDNAVVTEEVQNEVELSSLIVLR